MTRQLCRGMCRVASRRVSTMAWVGGLCALASAGCADHRISLDEFLQMQHEAEQVVSESASSQPAATQPATTRPAINKAIDEALGPYTVGADDVLGVVVTSPDDQMLGQPVQVRIDRKGRIDLPLVGPVEVKGMELQDVEQAIKLAYVPKYYKDAVVHVELITPKTTDVLVIGAVTLPGLVQLNRTNRDLLHGIVAAGGVSQLASGKVTLKRLRNPDEEVTLDLTDPTTLQAALALEPLHSGDIIHVHAATPNTVFVGGLVNAPRPQTYPSGVDITILQALAASGGLRTDVLPREATLTRRMPDGEEVHVKLNLDRITTGKDPNIKLAAGDILWVPHTAETRFQEWVNRNIFFRAGVSANVTYSVSGVEYMNRQDQQSSGLGGGSGLEQSFDPFGFLNRSSGIQSLRSTVAPP